MIRISARAPSGFAVTIDAEDLDAAEALIAELQRRGYRPASSGDQWQRTPSGEPICSRHGMAMVTREKQGDTWFSHAVQRGDATLYCRGFPHGPRHQDGFYVDASHD